MHFVSRQFFILLLLVLAPSVLQIAHASNSDFLEELFAPQEGAEPLQVKAGVRIQQITSVNQKEENFGVVASIMMRWHDDSLAKAVLLEGERFKAFEPKEFIKMVRSAGLSFPGFTIYNQQGRRHTQNSVYVVSDSGENIYFERFTATLQAPDFDFRQYPYDHQKFFIHLDLLAPASRIQFVELDGYSGMGGTLGEEEWVVTDVSSGVSKSGGSTGMTSSRFSFGFVAERHINYYVVRIFFPILIITMVSWITFFLNDYRKRIDMAGANLLVFIAFNFSISGNLPKLGYLTFMDSFMFAAFLLTSFIIMVNVVFRRMEVSGHKKLADRIDSFMIVLYPMMILLCLYLLVERFLVQ